MVILDGKCYQIKSDGKVNPAFSNATTPFACVTSFKPDFKTNFINSLNYKELELIIEKLLPTKNIFYGIKLTGDFSFVKTRSVPKQVKPYPLLLEVVKNQPTFSLTNKEGTLVGFNCPKYVKGINVPGFHFHFLSKDKQSGGHLLDCEIQNAVLEIAYIADFDRELPHGGDFYKIDLTLDKQQELIKIEK